MASPRPDVVDLLDVPVAPGGTVIAISDLHLPPARNDVSGRCAEMLASRLTQAQGEDLTVVLAGDIVEMLAYPETNANTILEAHPDLCAALASVTERGGQVIYTVGNHDGDLAWDLKAATAVRDLTHAKICLAADLVMPGGKRIRVEHGHQIDPYNCFHDPRNPLDTPLGHHIVREVLPKIEWLGGRWLDGAHEMADPGDFPSFLASRLVYRKLTRHLWWLILLPIALIGILKLAQVVNLRKHYPTGAQWLHDGEILGYGAVLDLAIIALIITIVSRRAWLSLSALALAERGYGQNRAARERADELIAEGYTGFLSGHTHHPELHAHGGGFYANSGSCTSVVEAIETGRGRPPVYLRTQQISWLELVAGADDFSATLKSARVELPGATSVERFMAAGRNPHAAIPCVVAAWPDGPDWPTTSRSLRKLAKRKLAKRKRKLEMDKEARRLGRD
jgi:UDP-2,3-diacylglucosamine pyrophosphatase LpxH